MSTVPAAPANDARDRLLTVAELADWLAVDADYVYRHAADLGVLRLGSGPRARLRFDLDEVRRRIGASCSVSRESEERESPATMPIRRPRRRRRSGTNPPLLPIRGRNGAS
jgi:hypothetical protein